MKQKYVQLRLKKCFCTKFFFQYLLFFQSQSCLLESTAAIFRQSAGHASIFMNLHCYGEALCIAVLLVTVLATSSMGLGSITWLIRNTLL